MKLQIALAGLTGAASVGLGAFGAHGAASERAAELLRTAGEYGLIHALAVLAVAALPAAGVRALGWTGWVFLAGVLLFSGSLAALAFGGPRMLGMITPVGGLAFIAGWVAVAVAGFRRL